MKLLQRALWAIVFLAVWLVWEAWISWFAFCDPQGQQHYADYAASNKCSAFNGPLVSVAKLGFGWLGVIASEYDKEIVALATAVIAIFTFSLWFSTHRLWQASKQQSIDMKASIAQAERSANIAGMSVNITQRAFVFGRGFKAFPNYSDHDVLSYSVFQMWINTGPTAATDVRTHLAYRLYHIVENIEPDFSPSENDMSSPTVLGPQSQTRSGFIDIPLPQMLRVYRWEGEIFMYSRVEYRDQFNPDLIHHHEECAMMTLANSPANIPPEGHPPYVEFRTYGLQNTTGTRISPAE